MLRLLSKTQRYGRQPIESLGFFWEIQITNKYGDAARTRYQTLLENVQTAHEQNQQGATTSEDNPLELHQKCRAVFLLERKIQNYHGFLKVKGSRPDPILDQWMKLTDSEKMNAIDAPSAHYNTIIKIIANTQQLPEINTIIRFGSPFFLDDLLEHGLHPDNGYCKSVSTDKYSLLTLAVMQKKSQVVKWLLDNGADPNTVMLTTKNLSPLAIAIDNKDYNSLRVLLEAGADIHVHEDMLSYRLSGFSLYDYVIRSKDARLFAIIESHITGYSEDELFKGYVIPEHPPQANTEVTDHPLHIAALWDDMEKIKAQLKNNIDPDLKDKMGSTALMHAATHGYIGAIHLLIDHGAQLKIMNKFDRNALMFATRTLRRNAGIILLYHTLVQSTPDEMERILLQCKRLAITRKELLDYMIAQNIDVNIALLVDEHDQPLSALSEFMHEDSELIAKIVKMIEENHAPVPLEIKKVKLSTGIC